MNKYLKKLEEFYSFSEAEMELIIRDMRSFVCDYTKKNKIDKLILGVSGGLDSSLIAYILKDIGVDLVGVTFKEKVASEVQKEILRVCDKVFFIQRDYLQIAFKSTTQTNNALRNGNATSRIQMILLYDLAKSMNGIVIGTSNLSEMNCGFFTLHGDGAYDLGLLKSFNKGFHIPQLAKYLGVPEYIINQAPSDGLGITEENTDESQIGMTYKEFDLMIAVLKGEHPFSEDEVKEIKLSPLYLRAVKLYEETSFKRHGPVDFLRKTEYF